MRNFNKDFQARLVTFVPKAYALYQPDEADEMTFATYQIRDYGRQAFTGGIPGQFQLNEPTVQVSVFDRDYLNCLDNAEAIRNFFTGFNGYLNPNNTGTRVYISQANEVFNTYDGEASLYQVVLDVTLTLNI